MKKPKTHKSSRINLVVVTILIFLIAIITWYIVKPKNIDKIIYRGVYTYRENKPFKKDTLFIVKNKSEIDTIMRLLKTAKTIKVVNPIIGKDELNVWMEIYFYSNNQEEIKIVLKPQFDNPIFYNYKGVFYDGSDLTNFLVKKFKEGHAYGW